MRAAAAAEVASAACLVVDDPPGAPGTMLLRRCCGPAKEPLLAVRAAVLCSESRLPAGLASVGLDETPPPTGSPALGPALVGA